MVKSHNTYIEGGERKISNCHNNNCHLHGQYAYLAYSRGLNELADEGYLFFNTVVNNISPAAIPHIPKFFKKIIRRKKYKQFHEKTEIELSVLMEPHENETVHANIYSGYDPDKTPLLPICEIKNFVTNIGIELKQYLKDKGVSYGKIKESTVVTVPANLDAKSTKGVAYALKDSKDPKKRERLLEINQGKVAIFQTKNFFRGSKADAAKKFKKKRDGIVLDLEIFFDDQIPANKSQYKNWLPKPLYKIYQKEGTKGLKNLYAPVAEITKIASKTHSIVNTKYFSNFTKELIDPKQSNPKQKIDDFVQFAETYKTIQEALKETGIKTPENILQDAKTEKELKTLKQKLNKKDYIKKEHFDLIPLFPFIPDLTETIEQLTLVLIKSFYNTSNHLSASDLFKILTSNRNLFTNHPLLATLFIPLRL